MTLPRLLSTVSALAALSLVPLAALGHGDVTPQSIDTSKLEALPAEWLDENPYRNDPVAIEIGASAYNQNCARCHGLGAVSGGIAPDLRYLFIDGEDWLLDTYDYYKGRYINGVQQNGMTKMPAFGDVLGQEAGWAILSYIEHRYNETEGEM